MYKPVSSPDLENDIYRRAEFYSLKIKPQSSTIHGNRVDPRTYQQFITNYMAPETPYRKIYLYHATGSGKTITAILTSINFINVFERFRESGKPQGTIYIFGFANTQLAFRKELLRRPQFGFVTDEDINKYKRLEYLSINGTEEDKDKFREFEANLKKRLSDRFDRGYYKFYGYQEFAIRLFGRDVEKLKEQELVEQIQSGKIAIDKDLMDSMENSLVICDEANEIYNTFEKNTWGIAIKLLADYLKNTKFLFMTATPLNNSPTEVVDVLQLLHDKETSKKISKNDLFDHNDLKPGALEKIKHWSKGVISYLVDDDPSKYPKWVFDGEYIKNVDWIKLINTGLSDYQKKGIELFKKYKGNMLEPEEYLSDEKQVRKTCVNNTSLNDITFPGNVYTSNDAKEYMNKSKDWKKENKIEYYRDQKTWFITGDFLRLPTLRKYSHKYAQMMEDIYEILSSKLNGKILIYHNNVHLSGTLLIAEVLKRNGVIEYGSTPLDDTRCSICGKEKIKHKESHDYLPMKFIHVNGELPDTLINANIDKFNAINNIFGHEIKIILGSSKIQSGYDLKGVIYTMIMSRPDNISTLLQIIGRAERQGSHTMLPVDMQIVHRRLYVSTDYEVEKYKEKMLDYTVIKRILEVFQQNAIDININSEIVKAYSKRLFKPLKLAEINFSTFEVYYAKNAVILLTSVIKRLFMLSSVWVYDELIKNVKAPPFPVEYNLNVLDEKYFIVALSNLIFDNSVLTISTSTSSYLERLYDINDKKIIIDNNEYIIVHIGIYYIRFPIKNKNELMERKNIYIDQESCFREYKERKLKELDVRSYLVDHATITDYKRKRELFEEKYKDVDFDGLGEAVCMFSANFHIMFIEELISYVFNIWTRKNYPMSTSHEFMFKMLVFYDSLEFIIFADAVTSIDSIYSLYSSYISDAESDIEATLRNIGKSKISRKNKPIENVLLSSLSKLSCDFCTPIHGTSKYKTYIDRSKDYLESKLDYARASKGTSIQVPAEILPIGHFMNKIPRFYLPDKGWFDYPELITSFKDDNAIENDIIIGYIERGTNSIRFKFKLRDPIHKLSKSTDFRKVSTGISCEIIGKQKIIAIAKKLGIEVNRQSVETLCYEIKVELMSRELESRKMGGKKRLRYFYYHIETMPNLKLDR